MSAIFHFTKFRLCKYSDSWVVSIKLDMNFRIQPPAKFIFLVSRKSGLTKSCLSSEDLLTHKVSCFYVEWWTLCIHLRSLNVCHFGMVEATGLKIMVSRSIQWHRHSTEFNKNLAIGSTVNRRKTYRPDTREGWWSHYLTFFLYEGK
jgi:hypothetical protein